MAPKAAGAVLLQRVNMGELQALAQGDVPAAWAGRHAEQSMPPAFVAQRTLALQQGAGTHPLAGALYWVVQAERVVGACGFKDAAQDGWVEIGYGIAPSCQGRGLGTQAVVRLCRIAFDSPQLQWVRACIEPGNAASAALAHKLGFIVGPAVTENDGTTVHIWTLAR